MKTHMKAQLPVELARQLRIRNETVRKLGAELGLAIRRIDALEKHNALMCEELALQRLSIRGLRWHVNAS